MPNEREEGIWKGEVRNLGRHWDFMHDMALLVRRAKYRRVQLIGKKRLEGGENCHHRMKGHYRIGIGNHWKNDRNNIFFGRCTLEPEKSCSCLNEGAADVFWTFYLSDLALKERGVHTLLLITTLHRHQVINPHFFGISKHLTVTPFLPVMLLVTHELERELLLTNDDGYLRQRYSNKPLELESFIDWTQRNVLWIQILGLS
ncbi:aac14553-5365-401c-9a48-64a4df976df3 [Sclerotinia trifoliorum]|uniref:Aac14553-5365-401c-9a48-64a4df976df3 n=1 Tax=Sclerotinia trifoliorum TaxID=28548 RepID=A0A8H2VNU2_9HELO|nr:aac14553-5365-401c-9a48-64a4df976df3 [Sclerotinia trifoliorum]